jgi:heavy metal translocating P-type ATPase
MSCCCQSAATLPPPAAACAVPPPKARAWLAFGIGAASAGLAMTLSLAINLTPPEGAARTATHGVLIALVLLCAVLLGGPLLRAAWAAARRGRIVTEQLFLAGMAGAFGASLLSTLRGSGDIYYEVVIVLLAIHALGRLLTERQRASATRTLDAWRETLDRCAVVQPDGSMRHAAARNVRPGEVVRITPGETVPLDGVITAGRAYVLETAHSGEPFPAAREPGGRVLAGSIVLDGPLDLAVTHHAGAREVDRLATAVAALSGEKSRLAQLADRAVRIFLPAVLVLSVLTFLAWWPAGGWPRALFHALAVLLVACPCALGIALPLAQRLGLQRLAALGVLPRHASLLERLARIHVVAFDKTGTLTALGLEAAALVPHGDAPPELRAMLAAMQRHSTHPVARVFWPWRDELPTGLALEQVTVLPGRGLRGQFRQGARTHTLDLGNAGVLPNGADPGSQDQRRLFAVLDGRAAATVTLRESPRHGLALLLTALKRSGIRTAILTGDIALPAELRSPGIEALTGLSAEEKAARIAQWERDGARVLFIGDGLNDTEAMTRATVSLALREGHATAREAADGEWLAPHFDALPVVLRTARQAERTQRRIITFAFGYNAIGIALATAGLLHPVAAALLMLASSLTVTTLANTGNPLDIK